MIATASLPLTVQGPRDLVIDLGSVTTEPNPQEPGEVARVITPPSIRPVDQVIAWLEQPAQRWPLNAAAAFEDYEARAAIGVCFRWGSYFALLADPQRPLWSAAARKQATRVSRITDGEMWRLNLEVSSAFATWLDLREREPERYRNLVAAADHWLPLEGRLQPIIGIRHGARALFRLSFPPPEGWEQVPNRALANALAYYAVRQGRLESIHGGTSRPIPLSQRRVQDFETREIVTQAISYLYGMLQGFEKVAAQAAPGQTWREQVTLVLPAVHSPEGWSLTDNTRIVRLRGDEPASSDVAAPGRKR